MPESELTARPGTLDGRLVGLLFNTKVNADVYLERLQEMLAAKYPNARFVNRRKPTATRPIAPELLKEMQECDVVVTAFGDCGSCSSWSVHDGAAFEKAGVPAIAVISEPFGVKSRIEAARMWGMPDLPIQVLPHPIGQLPVERMRQIATEAFDEIDFAITGDVTSVSDAYDGSDGMRSRYPSFTADAA